MRCAALAGKIAHRTCPELVLGFTKQKDDAILTLYSYDYNNAGNSSHRFRLNRTFR